MTTTIRQLVLGAAMTLAITGIGAGILGTGVVAGAEAMTTTAPSVEQRSLCKTYDQAEFFLLTGIDSEYGGMFCTAR